jgi:hypothetical protein
VEPANSRSFHVIRFRWRIGWPGCGGIGAKGGTGGGDMGCPGGMGGWGGLYVFCSLSFTFTKFAAAKLQKNNDICKYICHFFGFCTITPENRGRSVC